MDESNAIEHIVAILERKGLMQKYQRYLLTPYYVQEIIAATNDGKIKKAMSLIDRAEEVLNILNEDLETEDKKYLLEIIQQLRQAVSLAEE